MAKVFANNGDPDLIWVFTVCQLPFYGSPDNNGLSTDLLVSTLQMFLDLAKFIIHRIFYN